MKKTYFVWWFSLLLAGVLLGGAGCGSDAARAYKVVVTADNVITNQSVLVDLIGAGEFDEPEWREMPVTKYWEPGNAKRAGADKLTLEFGPGHPSTYTLNAADPRWKAWLARGVKHVVIVADIPGIVEDPPGNANARRKILPVTRDSWPKGTKTLQIQIQESGIRIDTPASMPKR